MGGFGGGMGLLGVLSTLLTLGLVAGLLFAGIWLWRRFGAAEGVGSWTRAQAVARMPAREILQTRYARGELTREEYQRMLQDLGGGNL
jgi:putative membrane protein